MNNDFQKQYLSKTQRVALWILGAHIPVCSVLALYYGIPWLPVAIIGALITCGPLAGYFLSPGSRTTSIAIGIAGESFCGLLIHAGTGIIEYHFHVFVVLATLVVLADWWVIVAATLTIAVHHVAFFFVLPKSVFNYQATFGIVLLHAAFVILEAIPAAIIARKFGRFVQAQGVLTESFKGISERIAATGGQVSSASQNLAQSSSEQATAVEEISSSLEQIAAMAKRMSQNSESVNDLARQSRDAADRGVADMQEMNAAMNTIKNSSGDIAKIIKTIDEIAFQTNILALNAAVEAARAGEAGMGFAVVADEVRNLAQRSAQAARETTAQIQSAIANTTQGVELSRKVSETLDVIAGKAREVDKLATEVASASKEQMQGNAQITASVRQMGAITQSNVAGAQESASVARELNSESEVLRQTLSEILALVGGEASAPAVETIPAIRTLASAPARSARPKSAIPSSSELQTT